MSHAKKEPLCDEVAPVVLLGINELLPEYEGFVYSKSRSITRESSPPSGETLLYCHGLW